MKKTKKKIIPARVVVKRSKSRGLGLFASEEIKKGAFIIEYIGEMITTDEANRRGGHYLFTLNKNFTLDGKSRKNKARYANYSCRPNAEADVKKMHVIISAIRNIALGEEITYDYGKEFFNEFIKPYGCHCGYCDGKGKKLLLFRRMPANF